MPEKKFSVPSWNVEHFGLKSNRNVRKILSHLRQFKPDVFAIYEVTGKEVYEYMVNEFPGYNFHITEEPQTQEILLGVKGSFTSFFTQKIEFKNHNNWLRPGALLSLRIGNEDYCLLFLHTKSLLNPVDFGMRDSQFRHAFNLKRKLDKNPNAEGNAKFIIVGDLNTMGMKYPFDKAIKWDIELKKLERDADRVNMRYIKKDYEDTWTNGKIFGNLDHVIASTKVRFRETEGGLYAKVSGWRELLQNDNQEFQNFIKTVSDHNSVYFEVL